MPNAKAGLDVFKIAGRSISGYLPSLKTGDPHHIRQPFTSLLEERLAMYLEYHPQVHLYHRGDVSDAFASSYGIVTSLGSPYRIHYLFNEKPHEYWPDFVGTFRDGSLLITEAGRDEDKQLEQAQAKAQAARRLVEIQGGTYWIGTETTLSLQRHHNLVFLHGRRQSFVSFPAIAEGLQAIWAWRSPMTVHDALDALGNRWPFQEIEATLWKMVGDAAAEGRLLVPLTEIALDRSTELRLLEPGAPPLLPEPLPSVLNIVLPEQAADPQANDTLLPSPSFDGMSLSDAQERGMFLRNIRAVTVVLQGQSLRQTAQHAGMDPAALSRLVRRTRERGQIACVPHGTYARDRALRPEFQGIIRKLYLGTQRPTIMAVFEDVRLQDLATELSQHEGIPILPPTYRQVWGYLHAIRSEQEVQTAPFWRAASGS